MNKNLYRIIFNKRRGQLMVVAENASSQGKAAKGEGGLDSGVFEGDGGGGINGRLRPLALAIFGALGMVSFVAGPAMGQIVADPNAPGRQRPTVVQSANGVTQVNIQTPSAAGVSRNTYSQFDVTANGAILNNSRGNVQTQTGGWVQGNPWLAGGSARVILNEVNSANPSQLRGYVEVAGQRAEVVIANPAGVAVDGGGFINASRVTLTTGTPILNGGNLDGYMVQRGVVSINGRGLDTSLSDYTAILARAAQINGGIWAQELKVVTGTNQIDAAHGVAGAVNGAGPAPAYALDVAQLGGMYAGKITLIGTEAGLGVRNAGVLAATAGNLVLQSNGWLSNSGNIQSAGSGSQTSIAVTGDVVNSGTVYAGGDSQVQAQGNIANSGVIAAQGNASVQATGAASRIDTGAGSVLAAGLNLDNTLSGSGKLNVLAGDLVAVHGMAVAAGDSKLSARRLELADAQVSGANVSLGASAGDLDASRAQVTARERLQLDAAQTVRSDGGQLTGQQLGVHAHDLSNVGGQLMQLGAGDLAIQLPGSLDNTRGVIATNSQALRLQAGSLSNQDGQIQHAGTGALEIGAAQINLQRGSIISNGAMALTGEQVDHRDARTVAGQLSINAGTLDNRGGSLAQSGQGDTRVQVRNGLDNRSGALESNGALSVQAGHVQNQKGRIVSGTDLALSTGALDNTEAILAAGRTVRLDSGDVNNTRGQIQAVSGDASLSVAKLNNTAGSVFAGGNLATRASEVLNSGNLYAAGSQALQVSGAVSNSGVIAAQGDNRIDASRIDSTAGSLLGAGIRADGSLAGSGQLQLKAAQAITAHGQNLAAGKTSLHATAIDLSGSQTGGAAIALNASAGNVVTDNALVTTTGLLSVTAAGSSQTLSNVRGTLSAGQLDLKTGSLDNRGGTLIQTGTGDTTLQGSTLDNTGGRIAVNSANLALTAEQVINRDGSVEHAGTGSLHIEATRFDDERGKVTGNGLVDIQAETLDHRHAVTSGQQVAVQAGQLDNSDGTLQQTGPGQMRVDVAQTLDNTRGNIAGNGGLQVQAGVLDNSKGRITSAASADIISKGALTNTDGVIAATQALQLTGVGLDNTRGVLQADNLRLDAATLLNQQGTVSAGKDLTARIGADLNNAGLLYAGRNQQLTVGGLLNNTGSIASVKNTHITAGKVTSSGLLGAGVKADGSLGTAGDLTINADGILQASGQNLAAGSAVLKGDSIDLSGSQTGAANIAITANTGDVVTNKALISASNLLAITANANNAQSLVNTQGQLVAGQLQLNVANLNNASGDIVQTGTGDTVISTAKLDNTAGRIAVNSANLALNATVLTNINGKLEHAGAGVLAINAGQFNNQHGKITGNGKLDITAAALDHRNATTVANQLTINAGTLDNRSGSLAQTGAGLMTVAATGQLDNTGGKIEGNGDALVKAATLLNSTGRIVAAQDAALSFGSLDNKDGSVAAGRNLALTGDDIDNTKGQLQAVAGDATLNVGKLNNNAGSVFAGANLNTTLASLNNTGSLYAAGNQTLNASGAIVNTGVIAAQGNNSLTANSLDSSASSLIGAGMQADGKLGTSGDLTIHTAQTLAAHGQNLAAGSANLAGANVDLSGSQTSAADIGLTATQGNVSTNKAVVTTPGTLNVTTTTTLHNTDGTLQAGQLDLHAANLDNAKGTVLQTGTGDTTIVTGNLDNTAGRIAVNSSNLNIDAVSVTNKEGKIEHAGTGILNLQAGVLDNSKGRITSAASAEIVSKAALNNTDGVLAATADLHLGGVHVDNTRGVLQADTLRVDAASLLNQQGTVSAGTDLTANVSGDLNNAGLLYAGRNQQLTVGGLLSNSGSIASVNNTHITAGKVTSSGLLGAGIKADGSLGTAGDLTLNADGVLQASGQNLAAGNAVLTGANVDLSGSQTGAGNIAITARSGDVLTNKAVISASNLLAIMANVNNGQSLVNSQGQLVAGQLQLNVANLNNASGDIVQKGTGDTAISTAKLDNTAGRIAVNSANLALNATVLTNINGKLEHAGAGVLAINANQFNNQHGKITGNGKLDITAITLDHRNATTVANQLTINAGTLDNRSGSLAQTGTGLMTVAATGQLDNTGGKIEGNGDALVKAATLLNSTGRIVAAQDAALNFGSLDNTEGTVAAGRNLALNGGDIDNTKGQLQAVAGDATLNVGKLNNNAGSVFAGGNLNATLSSLNNTGSLYAAGNQTLNASGAIVNTGLIAAQGNTSLTAKSIDSSASSLIGAGVQADGKLGTSGDLMISTTQTLAAHGQNLAAGKANLTGVSVDISGSQTSGADIGLTATTGDVSTNKAVVTTPGTLNVTSNATLRNTEGTLQAGQLDLHVGNLDNAKGTVLQTGTGDISIVTGNLDNTAGRIAVNSTNVTLDAIIVTNKDGKIEHAGTGSLTIKAPTLAGSGGTIIGNGLVDIAAGEFNHSKAITSANQVLVHAEAMNNQGGKLQTTGKAEVHVKQGLENGGGIIAANGLLQVSAATLDNAKGSINAATDASILVLGALNNTGGVIAGGETSQVTAQAIDNTHGVLQAGKGKLGVDASSLLNAGGEISAGTDLTTTIHGDMNNAGLLYAGGEQSLKVAGALVNTGSIAALGNTTVAVGSMTGNGLLAAGLKTDGSLAQTGDLGVRAGGVLQLGGKNLAAGNIVLGGAALDLSGSQTSGVNIALAAGSGDINTARATVSTPGLLSIMASAQNGQTLLNQQGSLSAGQLDFGLANLSNAGGSIIQTGSGNSAIVLTGTDGSLDNTGGRIATNSQNLQLKAAKLTNTDGKIEHAGSGTLSITAANLYAQRSQITGNGALDVRADYLDHRNGSAIAQQVNFATATLDNRHGELVQLGAGKASIMASISLDNGNGKIESNGSTALDTARLLNQSGRIVSGGSLEVGASGGLDNSDGTVAGSKGLLLMAGDVNNTRGSLQAITGDASLHVKDFSNSGGNVFAAANLLTQAVNVTSTGSLYAGGTQVLTATGKLSNGGVIAALGDTSISAASLDSSKGGLIAAGMQADGKLATTGNLAITTMQDLRAVGQNLAAGNIVFKGNAVDLGGSLSSGTNIALTATGGDISTSGAVVNTAGTLSVDAQSNSGQSWNNNKGEIVAGQLQVQTANLSNNKGSIVQSGSGDTAIVMRVPDGILDNADGRIAVNSANLTLGAGTLTNVSGKIEHAGNGLLAIDVAALNGQRGQITANGKLDITATSIDHRNASTQAGQLTIRTGNLDNNQGELIQLGQGASSIAVSQTLNNQGGKIASNGNATVSAQTLNNQGGIVQAAGEATLQLTASTRLDNSGGGTIAAGGGATLQVGRLLNHGGSLTSGATMLLTATQDIDNAAGLLAANGNVDISAVSLDNTGGKLASVTGNLIANTGSLMNASGQIQAGNDITLRTAGLNNALASGHTAAGSISGRNISIDTGGQALDNYLGTIAASQILNVQVGALNNEGGLLQGGGALVLNTHGQALNNSNAAAYAVRHPGMVGGISSGGSTSLVTGSWNNTGGYFGSAGQVGGSTGAVDNRDGKIVSSGGLDLVIGGFRNQGGQVQVVGNLNLQASAGTIDNTSGLIRSGATVTLGAGTIDNQMTQGAGQGIEGKDVNLSATNLNNSQGGLRADNNLSIRSSGSVNNASGLLSANNMVSVRDDGSNRSLTITNGGGTIIGGQMAAIRAAGLSGAGNLMSKGDLNLDLSGSFTVDAGGQVIANRNATLTVAGNLLNAGKVQAGSTLAINASSLDNTASGDINASVSTKVNVAGTLNNRGVIDGSDTQVDAGTLINIGSGRMYGDTLSIAASTLKNDVEGGVAATIAARGNLDIGAGTINNREHALIFSAGDMAIGGTLDGIRRATGSAASLTNASATIQALGNLVLSSRTVNLLNNNFQLEFNTNYATEEFIVDVDIYDGKRYNNNDPGVVSRVIGVDGPIRMLTNHYVIHGKDYTKYIVRSYRRYTTKGTIVRSDPAAIFSGGDLTVNADSVLNENSRFIAGRNLNIHGVVDNKFTGNQTQVFDSGMAEYHNGELHHPTKPSNILREQIYEAKYYIGNADQESISISSPNSNVASKASVTSSNATASINVTSANVTLTLVGPAVNAVAGMSSIQGSHLSEVGGGSTVGGSDAIGDAGKNTNYAGAKGRVTNEVGTTGERLNAPAITPSEVAVSGNVTGTDQITGGGTPHAVDRTLTGQHGQINGVSAKAVDAVAGVAPVSDVAEANKLISAIQSGPSTVSGEGTPGGGNQAGIAVKGNSIAAVVAKTLLKIDGAGGAAQADIKGGETASIGAAVGAAAKAAPGAKIGQARSALIQQVALANPRGKAEVVRTGAKPVQLPNASLFKISPSASAHYLVETDPRFANFRTWTGSDYMTGKVQLDPAVTQKRLGDGFYEQQLVREQLADLTGHRFTGDYSNDEEQYRGLMDAGVSYAQQWGLRPGVALTAEQMAALTNDVVWLVERDVTLADGSTQKALVPQVYVRLRADDIDGSGALLAGKEVNIETRGDLTNSGTIAGRDVVLLNAENVSNLGGRIDGDAVAIAARSDLNNISGTISANSTLQASAGRDINITTSASEVGRGFDRVAGLYVSGNPSGDGNLLLSAGRDVNIAGAIVSNTASDGYTMVSAGKDLNVTTVAATPGAGIGAEHIKDKTSEVQSGKLMLLAGNDINNRGSSMIAETQLVAKAGRDINFLSTTVDSANTKLVGNKLVSETKTEIDNVAGMYVTGTGEGNILIAQAGRDLTLTGSMAANAGVKGQTNLIAGNNLALNTIAVASTHDEFVGSGNYRNQSNSSEVGSQITGTGNVNLQAGHDLLARAADVQAGGALGLLAGNDISLVNGFQNEVTDTASKSTKKGFWNKTTRTKHDVVDTTTAIGTSLGGSSVTVQAGHDLQVTGSSILSDDATRLLAGNNITIDAATNTVYELHHSSTKKSGFMSSGGIGFSYGTKTTTVDQERDATLQSGEARSSIGATGGALTMVAGNNVTIGGSDILAATDLDIIGKSVTIKPGQDNEKGKFEVKTTQDGLTLALGGSVISAIQTLQTMSTAASTAKDGRVTAMAAATTAMAANAAAKDMMKEGGPSISISLTAGHSESIQTQTTASTTHSGSVLTGNNINITAMGGGKDSNINILGSDLNAKNDIRLHADNNVNLLAAQDTESQHSKSSSLSASAGVAASVSSKGMSFGFTASVSGSKGHEDGDGTTQLNTHVNAGDKLVITSGGDTNIKGAVASANQVIADIKGNLNLESLQDTAKFDSKSQSLSVSGTVGFGASVSGSYSQSNMHNDYASVQEQSGIKAGDGGFQIKVGDNTDLKGAVISATEAGKLNSSLTTATLTHSDIVNHAISKGSSVGVSGGMSFAGTGPKNDNLTNVGGEKDAKTAGLPIIVGTSENSSSTTRSGISGGTLVITDDAAQRSATGKGVEEAIAGVNRDVTTGVDSSGKIGNNFDKAKLQATMDVTAAFAAAAANEVEDYAKGKLAEAFSLKDAAFREPDETKRKEMLLQAAKIESDWAEGGTSRLLASTAIGALSGGLTGAAVNAAGTGASGLLNRPKFPDSFKSLSLEQQAQIGYIGAELGLNAFSSPDEYKVLKEVTDLQHDPSLQDISPAERLRRVDNYLSLRGATAEQIADIHESYVRAGFIKNPNVEVHTVPASDVSNENLSDASSAKPDAFLLSRYLDKGSQHVGSVVEEFGNFIESKPVAKFALEGADFMAGPVIFGVKRVPAVEKMIDKVTGEMTDLLAGGFERAGYAGSDVQHGANGTTVILSVGIGGIAGAVKKLGKSIDFSRNTAQVAERTIETTPIPIRNAELIGADGKVIAHQNPLTNVWEQTVPALSKDGVNSASVADSAAIRARVLSNVADSQAARASSQFEQLGRYETAYNFYANAGFSADRAAGHLAGIDFMKPVSLTELMPGTNYLQYPMGGKMGNYFATPGTPAETIGINPAGRVPTLYTPTTAAPALRSTAADILDTWTVPSQPYMTQGGGIQFFVPNKGVFIEVPKP
ncbi:hemagglutinin repeat-containing protein [Janthinobacterium sp. HSC-3S05]|uniref:two-partner secretion domain-containing protein n=1 Tax=Janthinobacterium lividum TaxID=29581 RepID=UPI001CD85D3C|nr:hemagglutinin repeat-containing protein [Janthinobacterium lividum]MCA1859153.1 hemagglutinin repeat-containing protein [Janthinobacterium lividum]